MNTPKTHADPVLAQLDAAARAPVFGRRAAELVQKLQRQLNESPETPMTWEPVPLTTFDRSLPAEIGSCWVFVLRPGTALPAERHSNSHQRSLSLEGSARFELREGGRWVSHAIEPGSWASAPTGTWHRWFAGSAPLALLSFHTVAAEDLLEEHPARPDEYDGPTTGRRYQE
ncbi:MAG: cupin domain-containing protein [Gemmatimonadota bacterium]